MTGREKKTPDWLIERLAAGDLPPERAAAVRARLALEPDGEERLANLAESNRAILAALPPPAMADAIRACLGRRRPWRMLAFAPVAAAAVLALVVLMRPGVGPGPDARGAVASRGALEPTRIKAPPHLVIHQVKGLAAERLAPGALLRARDVVQVAYVAGGRPYGAIVSLDGNGRVTRHLPEAGDAASALAQTGAVALPHSFELDDAPRFERFFLVTSRTPFTVAPVMAAAGALAAHPAEAARQSLSLPSGLEQTSFLLRKAD